MTLVFPVVSQFPNPYMFSDVVFCDIGGNVGHTHLHRYNECFEYWQQKQWKIRPRSHFSVENDKICIFLLLEVRKFRGNFLHMSMFTWTVIPVLLVTVCQYPENCIFDSSSNTGHFKKQKKKFVIHSKIRLLV